MCVALTGKTMSWSGHNFAHVTTAVLSQHVQTCNLTGSYSMKNFWHFFFNHELINCFWVPAHLVSQMPRFNFLNVSWFWDNLQQKNAKYMMKCWKNFFKFLLNFPDWLLILSKNGDSLGYNEWWLSKMSKGFTRSSSSITLWLKGFLGRTCTGNLKLHAHDVINENFFLDWC